MNTAHRIYYFGYPIDQNYSSRAREATVAARLALVERGVPFYDPGAAFQNCGGLIPGPEIWAVNHRALTAATAALFVLPLGVPTIGVPREIQEAAHQGIPVAILSEQLGWSIGVGQSREKVFGLDQADLALTWLARQEPVRSQQAKLPVKITQPGAKLPARHYADDAGLDLYVSDSRVIPPNSFRDVPCGIAVEIPSSCWGLIKSRSSTLRERGLLVHDGVIDPGWRGELFAGVWNLTDEEVVVKPGERIAQLILHTNVSPMFEPVEVLELAGSERGTNGFGSTGT